MCQQGCGLDTAGYCAIAASILWFLASILSCAVGRPVDNEEDDALNEEEPSESEQSQYSSEESGSGDDDPPIHQTENDQGQPTQDGADEGKHVVKVD